MVGRREPDTVLEKTSETLDQVGELVDDLNDHSRLLRNLLNEFQSLREDESGQD